MAYACDERTLKEFANRVLKPLRRPLTVEHVAPQLARYEFIFSHERPHAALADRTPNEYLVAQEAA